MSQQVVREHTWKLAFVKLHIKVLQTGRRATLWSAEEMLDGQQQRVDIPAHARTAYNGLLKKRVDEDLC